MKGWGALVDIGVFCLTMKPSLLCKEVGLLMPGSTTIPEALDPLKLGHVGSSPRLCIFRYVLNKTKQGLTT